MARYVTLIRFTDQGARGIKKSAVRGAAFINAARKAGVTVESQLWTVGSRDGLLVLRGDERKVLRCVAQLGALGNVHTETLQAFDAKEFKAITG